MGQRLPEEKVPFPHVHEGLIWAIRVLFFNHSGENEGGGRGQGPRPGQLSSSWAPLQSDSLVVCEVDPELKEKLRKFRFRKETDNAAIIMKVDKDRQMVVLEEEFQNISPEELKMELPERQPRFVVYSYKYVHADGRVSYPLCFIFSSPVGCKPEQQMMYAGSKNRLVQTAELTKVWAWGQGSQGEGGRTWGSLGSWSEGGGGWGMGSWFEGGGGQSPRYLSSQVGHNTENSLCPGV